MSERFLAQLESGRGNVSIVRLDEVASALGWTLDELVRVEELDREERHLVRAVARARPEHRASLRRRLQDLEAAAVPGRGARIALIGLRGAGKSTLGRAVAERIGIRFVELREEIEAESGLSVHEIFPLYGFEGFRRLERTCLEAIARTEDPVVLAASGGLVDAQDTFRFLLGHFWTVWLEARPEEHMGRVRAQGDQRPMRGYPRAMDDLRAILARRAPLHAQAHARLDTSGRALETSIEELAVLIRSRLEAVSEGR